MDNKVIKALSNILDMQDTFIVENVDIMSSITKDEYPYISASTNTIVELLVKCKPFINKKIKYINFIDLGSGANNVLLIASHVIPAMLPGKFLSLVGVEKNLDLVSLRREMLDVMCKSVDIHQRDLRYMTELPKGNYPPTQYSQTIVWFNRPFRDTDFQIQFQQNVFDQYPKGTIFLSPMSVFNVPEKFSKLKCHNIFKKR